MNILFITTKTPLPLNDGHSLRSYNLLKCACNHHDVHLLSFVKYQEEYQHKEELLKLCQSVELVELEENNSNVALFKSLLFSVLTGRAFVVHKYRSTKMAEAIQRLLSQVSFDIVHLDMLFLGVYANLFTHYPILLDEHNVESDLVFRRLQSEKMVLKRIFYRIQYKRLYKFEKGICNNVQAIITCSEIDRKKIKLITKKQNIVSVVPNGVDTTFFNSEFDKKTNKNQLVFVGGLNWFPNLDALKWFDFNIFPELLKKYKKCCLHVIGYSDYYDFKHKDSFVIHGRVEDIRPIVAESVIFVVPLRIGGGTRLKILNAMSMGKLVISTTVGAEGLGVTHGDNIILADSPTEFVSAIDHYINAPDECMAIGKRARKFVTQNFSWASICEKLGHTYIQLYKE